ncbi:NlpC/P60 family protein [Leucobacter ruminantium]|uniref:C40 family peptidase n=1 Tax=Leucobacter ruminantium TaxID=1289170 RepID=A0A939RY54_9MICO|nr:NlpC/P60 family protein [Leucobacter ruminantium]MBO1804516.1 C40 family peptidase [Leucobacter ruminantium]
MTPQHQRTETATTEGRRPGSGPARGRRAAQAVGAAALSIGMVGTFSLPANAVAPEVTNVTLDDFAVPAQTLRTVDADAEAVPLSAPEAELSAEALEQDRLAAEAEAQAEQVEQAAARAEQADAAAPKPLGKDIPVGEGAQGIVDAALAQLGVQQDCTDLVQNSLAAIGVIDRRDAGGFDLGPSSGEYVALGGTIVTSGDYAPGDVLFWEGRHNAIYIGNGQAVHGGYGGDQTVVASAYLDGPPETVVRFG